MSRAITLSAIAAAVGSVFLLCAVPAWAQTYPVKPIRLVAPEIGGGSDFVARIIAAGLSASLGKSVVVDNRGFSAGEVVARAPADGYTLLVYGSPLWLSKLMRPNLPFDPVKDFAPITLAASTPDVVVVHASTKIATVRDLVAAAKAAPGQLNYSSGSTGSTQHLAAELFNVMAGTNIVRVPYRGTGGALNAVIANEAQLMFPSVGSAMPHIRSGRLRALAVTSAQPSVLAPGLPTVSASGVPGYEATSPFGVFAPAKTPLALIERLNRELARVIRATDSSEALLKSGVEPVGSTPGALKETIAAEMTKWGELIKRLGIRE